MKKILFGFFVLTLALFAFFPTSSYAEDELNLASGDKFEYALFHLETCPHCRDEIEFIEKEIMPKYGQYIDLKMYEVSEAENQKTFKQYQYYYKFQGGGVPVAVIDGKVVQGYGSDKTTGKEIMTIIEDRLRYGGVLDSDVVENGDQCEDGEECIRVPVLGRIDATSFSLPILTIVLGLLDGFNPCAMWALLFLISLLLGMEDKRRMWLLGSIFILVSGIVYFIFMAAWLQFIMFIGMVSIIRLIIGGTAIGVGSINIRDWWRSRKSDGVVCKVSSKEGTKKTFEKIKDIVHKKSLWWSIAGIILLGFSVNLVELACSAGFPAIFTQVLALNDIPMWQRYIYMFGYILFYILDDMIVFAIAMVTLKSKTIGGKYAKYANLTGGVIIFILGILLIFKPEWLMFG
ncbi:hypothetical protein HOF40_03215 [Candidatus Parcubacteria bacterium]|jgi:hypothetical protein|nr:hypothetical protein [Candidatus Parcubacteria bacterium]MBT3949071.1 hypothetical protein [Candidatus Parcubacteria bacterium]